MIIIIKVLAAVCVISGLVAHWGITTQIGYMSYGMYVVTGAAALELTRREIKRQEKCV